MHSLAPRVNIVSTPDCPEGFQRGLCRTASYVVANFVHRSLRTSVMIGLSAALLGGPSLALAAEVNAPKAKGGIVSSVRLTGVTFVKSREGVSNVLLMADEADFRTAISRVYLQGMSVETKSDVGNKEFWLRCDRGIIELESGDFEAEGNVQGQMADGRSFETESAQYDDELSVISTNVPVLLREATGTLRGGGFQYWVREDRLQLTGGAVLLQSESGTEAKGGSGQ
jgi:LPS export ABC transporter protein LptC